MPLAKKAKTDAFAALVKEAEESGITLKKTDDGEFIATFDAEDGEIEWGPGADARAVLDDMVALATMEENKDVFSYEEDGTGGARVSVEGIRGHFDAATFAEAFAMAEEAVQKAKAEAEKPAKAPKPAKVKAATPAPEPEPEATTQEVMPPVKPNGRSTIGDSDTLRRLSSGFHKLADAFKELGDAMMRDEALVPFMGEEFSEDDPPPATSRVKRERIARDKAR